MNVLIKNALSASLCYLALASSSQWAGPVVMLNAPGYTKTLQPKREEEEKKRERERGREKVHVVRVYIGTEADLYFYKDRQAQEIVHHSIYQDQICTIL